MNPSFIDTSVDEIGNGRMSLTAARVITSLFEYLKEIGLGYTIGGSALQGTMIMTSDIDVKVLLTRRIIQSNGMLNLAKALQNKNFKCEFIKKGYDFIIIDIKSCYIWSSVRLCR